MRRQLHASAGRHDLAETIGREADAIVNGGAFVKAIETRVYGQF